MEICLNAVIIGQGTRGTPILAEGSFGNAFLTNSFLRLRLFNVGRSQNINREKSPSLGGSPSSFFPARGLPDSLTPAPHSAQPPPLLSSNPLLLPEWSLLFLIFAPLVHLASTYMLFKSQYERVLLYEATTGSPDRTGQPSFAPFGCLQSSRKTGAFCLVIVA